MTEIRWLGYVTDEQRRDLHHGRHRVRVPVALRGLRAPTARGHGRGRPGGHGEPGCRSPEIAGDAALLVDPTDTDQHAAGITTLVDDETGARRVRRRGPATPGPLRLGDDRQRIRRHVHRRGTEPMSRPPTDFNDLIHHLPRPRHAAAPDASVVLSGGCPNAAYFEWFSEHYPTPIERHLAIELFPGSAHRPSRERGIRAGQPGRPRADSRRQRRPPLRRAGGRAPVGRRSRRLPRQPRTAC